MWSGGAGIRKMSEFSSRLLVQGECSPRGWRLEIIRRWCSAGLFPNSVTFWLFCSLWSSKDDTEPSRFQLMCLLLAGLTGEWDGAVTLTVFCFCLCLSGLWFTSRAQRSRPLCSLSSPCSWTSSLTGSGRSRMRWRAWWQESLSRVIPQKPNKRYTPS